MAFGVSRASIRRRSVKGLGPDFADQQRLLEPERGQTLTWMAVRVGTVEMAQLTQLELANWAALYAATALCCAIALALAIVGAGVHVCRERAWKEVRSVRQAILFVRMDCPE